MLARGHRSPPLFALAAVLASVAVTAACGSDEPSAGPDASTEPDAGTPGTPRTDGGDAGDGGADAAADATPDAPPDTSKCADGIQNGAETDLDCGGPCAPCAQCARCSMASDCETGNCMEGRCGPVLQSLPALDATRRSLRHRLDAIESGMRCELGIYHDVVGILGRESYRFSESEPRWTGELLGAGASVLDAKAFYVTRPFEARYWVARIARKVQDESAAAAQLTPGEKKGYAAYARTIVAYQLLLNLTLSDANGLRVDVLDTTAAPTTKSDALAHIETLLNDGFADLTDATFSFPVTPAFESFPDPASFGKLNRALAARVALYRERWADALTYLGQSFFDLNGDFAHGAYLRHSTVPGDMPNPLFLPPNATGEARVAHPSFAADVVPGDDRIGKTIVRDSPVSQAGLTSGRDVRRYDSAVAAIPIIRNEELMLIFAEAKLRQNALPDTVVAINRVRTGHNLPPYAGAISTPALLDELLHQRRYSLFLEGHRWIDVRRTDRLATLPLDRVDDDVWSEFPLP